MKDPKVMELKALFGETDYAAIKKHCKSIDVPGSKFLRDLAIKAVSSEKNDSHRSRKNPCPCRGHVQATRPPKMNLRAWSARRNI